MALNDFLSDIGHRLKNNLINISEYIITKQLTKLPKDYNKFDSLPHVAVADRLIRTGKKAETQLVNNYIEYVICLPTNGEPTNNLASKAFSPDELLHSKGSLKIDVDWYTSQQLMPPLTRLIEHIEGIEIDFVAQCLGVDLKKHKYTKQDDDN